MLAKSELVGIIRERYLGANKKDKTRILDELDELGGHRRQGTGTRRAAPGGTRGQPSKYFGM